MQAKNPTIFNYKNETKIKQGYDNKTYSKLVLNKLKLIKNSTSIYGHWAFISRIFFKKLPTYMWPMFAHVHPCVNYEMN